MQLHGPDQSPFVARVRIACRAKNLLPDMIDIPAEGLKSAGFLDINPIGKVPVLVDDGLSIIESETILDYLEDRYPDPSLRPSDPQGRAKMRTIIRITDNYVLVPVTRLFTKLDPALREPALIDREIAFWRAALVWLAAFVPDAPFACGKGLTLADCVLAPSILLSDLISNLIGTGDLIGEHPTLSGYRSKIRGNESVQAELERVEAAIGALRA